MTAELRESDSVALLENELAATREELLMVKESHADLEMLYQEDIGWQLIGTEKNKFSADGRNKIAEMADLVALGNALVKRGLSLRTMYIWGQGVEIKVRDDGSVGQDVNKVWTDFAADPTNQAELTSMSSYIRHERKLATRGEAFYAFPTDAVTGRVWVRHIPAAEIVDRVCNPDDAAEVWFYKRSWNVKKVDPVTGVSSSDKIETYYPAMGFKPLTRPASYGKVEIKWDSPLKVLTVNNPDEDWRGLPDILAAMPWARVHKEFLEDVAAYMRSVTKIVGTVTSNNKKTAQNATRAMQEALTGAAGGFAVMDPNSSLDWAKAASVDSSAHKDFATMVASALDVPLTMLLGDPGTTGARATAETLDQPTELMARLRRELQTEFLTDVVNYVVDSAVIAPRGPLRGVVTRDRNRLVVELPEGDDRTVEVSWPDFDSTPLKEFVDAVAAAAELPPLEKFKLYAQVFKLENVDDLIKALTDDQGNFIDPAATAAAAAVKSFRDGGDPVPALDTPAS